MAFTSLALAAPGDLDLQFGSGGYAALVSSARFATIRDIAVDRSGNIYGVGNAESRSLRIRLRPDGTPDPAFSQRQVPNVNGIAVRIDAEGRAFIVDSSPGTISVERLLSNGEPDPAYGTVTVPGGSPRGTVMLADGTLVFIHSPSTFQFAFAAVGPNGTTDTRWTAASPRLGCAGGGTATAATIASAPGNRILALVVYSNGANPGACLTRFNADGSVDSSYGSAGQAVIPLGSPVVTLQAFAVDRDGSAAISHSPATSAEAPSTVTRVTAAGAPDTARSLSPGGALPHHVRSIAFQPDGKLLVLGVEAVGATTAPDETRTFVRRFNLQGALDTAFGPAPGGSAVIGPNVFTAREGVLFLDDASRILALGHTGVLFGSSLARLLNDAPPQASDGGGSGGGGGGCGTLRGPGPFDPVFPALLLAAMLLLAARRRR